MGMILVCSFSMTWAQKKEGKKLKLAEGELILESDTMPPSLEYKLSKEELELAKQEESQRKIKKKRQKRSIYFGIKTKSGFVRSEGSDLVMTVFRIIDAKYLIKNTYQREIWYYDVKSRKLKSDHYFDLSAKIGKGAVIYLLHGQFQRYKEGILREEGYFYKGLKHDKWQEMDKESILLEKIRFEMGYPIESKITYYDDAEIKIKEVIPIQHGFMQGTYYAFHENGVLAMEGKYENNQKIGLWRAFYDNRQRKLDTQYTLQWHTPTEPLKLREWERNGIQIFDKDRGGELKNKK